MLLSAELVGYDPLTFIQWKLWKTTGPYQVTVTQLLSVAPYGQRTAHDGEKSFKKGQKFKLCVPSWLK